MTVIRIKERVKTFNARMIVYEEEGELKIYSAPATIPYDEFIANFEREKRVSFDPATGTCKPCEPREETTTLENDDAHARREDDANLTATAPVPAPEEKNVDEPQRAPDDLARSRQ